MNTKKIIYLLIILICSMGIFTGTWADLPTEAGVIKNVSIGIEATGADPITLGQSVGFKVLGLAKMIVSGLALIYLVMIGVYMVTFSENEERVKTQRRQIIYALVGFLFLNIPGLAYQIFFSTPKNINNISDTPSGWSTFMGGFFWDTTVTDTLFGNLIAFFQVFIFGAAVVTFTWGLFRLIVSGGDEEKMKIAKNRILYGILGLIFMGFVRFWGNVIAAGDWGGSLATVSGKIFSIAIFFAGPVAIFFLMWGGYYYITSGGDEERTKKGKNIILNTFIATLILLAGYSFMTDLINFTF